MNHQKTIHCFCLGCGKQHHPGNPDWEFGSHGFSGWAHRHEDGTWHRAEWLTSQQMTEKFHLDVENAA